MTVCDDELLQHLDSNFFFRKCFEHQKLRFFFRITCVDTFHVVEYRKKLIIDQVLLKKVIFELATAHEESLQNQEKSFPTEGLMLMQISF